MAKPFWLPEWQWAAIEPLLPRNQPGARRLDDRRVISGIVHMLKSGGRWQDCPACYGLPTKIDNRYHRWSGGGIWAAMLAALVQATPGGLQMMDSTAAKAHRLAAGGKGG
jgi:transposase